MPQLLKNNVSGVLGLELSAVATTMTLISAADFPAPTGGDHYLVTLFGLNSNGQEDKWEIVRVTAKASNTLTITRAQEGTTARLWPYGTTVQMRLTAASVFDIASGGTGQTTKIAAFDALSPATTLGDLIYSDGTDNVRLAGNTTANRRFLRQTGTGAVSAAPAWDAIADGDIPATLTGKTYNGLTLTAAATGFTVAGGTSSKTLTVGNTLSLAGTDGSTLNIGAGGTLGSAAYTAGTAYAPAAGSSSITTVGTIGSGTWQGSAIGIAYGGTGAATKAAGFNALSPVTTLGDIIYGDGANSATRLAGNTTATKLFLTQTGSGTASAAPGWNAIVDADVPSVLTGKTYNGLTLTSNAIGFQLSGGTTSKTLVVSNSLTLSGTDGSTLKIGSGGTLGSAAYTASTAYQPIDADLTAIAALAGTSGFLKTNGAGSWSVDTATYLTGNQSITLSGDVTGSGTTAITASISAAAVTGKALTGYTAGTNTALAATDTILAAFGKVQGQISARLTGNQSITISGDASGTGATAISLTLANSGAAAGTYTKVTVDAKGRVTGGASLASGDLPTYTGTITSSQVTTALGFTPYNSTNPSGYITSSSLSSYLPLAGGAMTGGFREARVAMGANDINLSSGNFFTKTISGAATLTVSNVPAAGTAASFILDLTNGGSATVTWWAGMKWASGTAPTLTASGRDVLGFFTHDGGTTWTGLLLGKDVK